MKTGPASVGLAIFCILAISSQVPTALGAPVRISGDVRTVSCTGVQSGFTGQVAFYAKTRFSIGDPTFECNDDQTTTVVGTRTGIHKDRLIEWSVTVSIIDPSGVIVAENFDSGGKSKGNLTATVTATFDTMSVTGSLEWFRLEG